MCATAFPQGPEPHINGKFGAGSALRIAHNLAAMGMQPGCWLCCGIAALQGVQQ